MATTLTPERKAQIEAAKRSFLSVASQPKTQAEKVAENEQAIAAENARREGRGETDLLGSQPQFQPKSFEAPSLSSDATQATKDYIAAQQKQAGTYNAAAQSQYERQASGQERTAAMQDYEILTKKIQDEQKKKVSALEAGVPKKSTPGLGETDIDRLNRELGDARSEGSYFKGEAEKSGKELGLVSTQIADFNQQLGQYQKEVTNLVDSLNKQQQGRGDVIGETLDQIGAAGMEGNLTPEAIQKIQEMALTGLTDEQLSQGIQEIVTTGAISDSTSALTRGSAYQGLVDQGYSSAEINDIDPELAEQAGIDYNSKGDGSIINPKSGVTLNQSALGQFYTTPSGLSVPRNKQTLLPDYQSLDQNSLNQLTSYDVFSIDFATTNRMADLKDFYTGQTLNQMANMVLTNMKVSEQELMSGYSSAKNMLDLSKIQDFNDIEDARSKVLLDKSTSLDSINEEQAKSEAYYKAMIDNYGLEGSSAQLAIMGNLSLKFKSQAAQVARGYDDKLASLVRLENQSTLQFAMKSVDLENNRITDSAKMRVEYTGQLMEINKSKLASQLEKMLIQQNSYSDYIKNVANYNTQTKKDLLDAAKDAKKDMWDKEKWYSEQSGMMVSIDEEGQPVPLMGSDGKPIYTFEASKLYNEMRKGELKQNSETGEFFLWNPYTMSISPIGNTDPTSGLPFGGNEGGTGQSFSVGGQEFKVGGNYTGQGECVGFSRLFSPSLPSGLYTLKDKLAVSNSSDVQKGDTVFFDVGTKAGHAAVVTDVNEDGTFNTIDANYDDDPNKNIIKTHSNLTVDSIARDANGKPGIFRGQTNQFSFGPQIRSYNKTQKSDLLKIRGDFSQRQEIKDFRTVDSAYRKILKSADIATGPGDLAMLFSFVKMLDPTSVVREQEFSNAEAAMGYLKKTLNMPGKFVKGTRLTPEGRTYFMNTANSLYESQKEPYDQVVNEFTDLAYQYGLSPEDILGKYDSPKNIESPEDEFNRLVQ